MTFGAKALLWGAAAVMALGIIEAIGSKPYIPDPPRLPPEAKPANEDTVRLAIAAEGASRLRKAMRNPGSFDLSSVLLMKNGAVCYEYRAQNGFGGMNVEQAVLGANGEFKTSGSAGLLGLWNKECAGKTGDDQTSNVKMLLKYGE